MRTEAQQAGDAAEATVARYLEDMDWTLLGAHVRVGRAELDLVAIDPRPPPGLVLVEVRWRRSRDFGLPEETIRHGKRSVLHRAGFALVDAGRLPDGTRLPALPLRFDLIVVEPGDTLRHYRHGV